MKHTQLKRLLAACAQQGLTVTHPSATSWSVRLRDDDGAVDNDLAAEVLLPAGFPVEGKALHQLATLAATRHPRGGHVCRCQASPDFHPGDGGVAIGSVAELADMVVPAAIGSDIHCGMRLHTLDVDVDHFLRHKQAVVAELSGHFFGGTRDVALSTAQFRALFADGLEGLATSLERGPRTGVFAHLDLSALREQQARIFDGGVLTGSDAWMPAGLIDNTLDVVRDDGLGTIGGGNHFVEVQVVDEVVDRTRAFQWGVRRGQLAVMIHSGSRHVGKHVGRIFAEKARRAWPAGLPYPRGELFGLSEEYTPELTADYIAAENAAGHYAFVNRLVLSELVRQTLQKHLGDVDMPLLYDVPHNLTRREQGRFVVRKGACPAHAEQPVIVPGSMGTSSYLAVGRGNDLYLSTASHGAGRAITRHDMSRVKDLGLNDVECITPRAERRIEEAPAAYKPIAPVIDVQVAAGIIDVVARLRPLLTFKA
jgi:tRNA-splicing ligase RtcB